jgi:hypothetical protein
MDASASVNCPAPQDRYLLAFRRGRTGLREGFLVSREPVSGDSSYPEIADLTAPRGADTSQEERPWLTTR